MVLQYIDTVIPTYLPQYSVCHVPKEKENFTHQRGKGVIKITTACLCFSLVCIPSSLPFDSTFLFTFYLSLFTYYFLGQIDCRIEMSIANSYSAHARVCECECECVQLQWSPVELLSGSDVFILGRAFSARIVSFRKVLWSARKNGFKKISIH